MRHLYYGLVLINLGLALPAPADEPRTLELVDETLPSGAYASFGSARLQHEAKAVAFIDAKTIVCFGASLRIYDAATGKMREEFRSELMKGAATGQLGVPDWRDAAFSGDGK